jgi:ATP-dependent DNA helicase RecG
MNWDQLQRYLAAGEGRTVEFKVAREALPRDLFETVCAFLNREGGTILLGVADDGTVLGVEPGAVERLTRDIVNLSNNPQKLDPPCILSPDVVEMHGKQVLVIQVPASSDIHQSAGVVYDRAKDGDFKVKEPSRIAGMVYAKRGVYSEQRVYPYLRLIDFEPGILKKARRLIEMHQPEHPWLFLSDEEFLVKAGFRRRDPLTGTEGYTLAAGLMFGKEEVILQMVPHYRIDALVRRANMDRYDDRVDIRCNLIDAYEHLMQFVAKHLPDPFHLEGDQRVSLREKIFREVVSNVLVHREYMDARPATFTIFQDRVEVVNAAHPNGHGPIVPTRFAAHAKNPVLCRFFRQIGRAEELGSGVLNITRYLPFFAKGKTAQFVEDNPFVTIIPLPVETSGRGTGRPPGELKEEGERGLVEGLVEGLAETQRKILKLMSANPNISKRELAAGIGVSTTAIDKNIASLKVKGLLRRIGPDKGGHWEVVEVTKG